MAESVARREAILPLILRRDRLPTLVGLVGVTVVAWLYLIWLAAGMSGMSNQTPAGDMSGMAGMSGTAGMSGMAGMSSMSAGGMAGMAMPATARLDRGLFRPDVPDVGGHDGRHDAAECFADDPALRPGARAPGGQRGEPRRNGGLRRGLSRRLGAVQPGRGARAVGARAGSTPVADDGQRQPLARRRPPDRWPASISGRRSRTPVWSTAGRRSPSSPTTGVPAGRAPSAWACTTACSASAAAGC